MARKITTFRSLLHMVYLDKTNHTTRDLARLFVSALTDWGNCQNIPTCIALFKAEIGNPLTIENTAYYRGGNSEDWAWRWEVGAALNKMIEISTQVYGVSDFDTIVDNFLSYYEQKFLMTTEGKPIKHTGYAVFNIYISSMSALKEVDFLHWLGIESDSCEGDGKTDWTIRTPLTVNVYQSKMIETLVKRLMPIKDRLIALKQEYSDLQYQLNIVVGYFSDMLNAMALCFQISDFTYYRVSRGDYRAKSAFSRTFFNHNKKGGNPYRFF